MNKFNKFFGVSKSVGWNGKAFLPVVHLKAGQEFDSGYLGALTAYNAGADGVFLINHSAGTNAKKLAETVAAIQKVLNDDGIDFPIGANFLDLTYSPYDQIELAAKYDIPLLWSDNTGDSVSVGQAKANTGWEGIYFGAVAFKYQAPVTLENLPSVAKNATWMDVLITSGDGTGQAIDLNKAAVFSAAVPGAMTGIASGVSIANIDQILPHFSAILVASSICSDFHTLDPQKTKELADTIHNWHK